MPDKKGSTDQHSETNQKYDNGRPAWEEQAGLAADTTSVRIYPSRQQKQQWEDETDGSLSQYLINLIQEARADRHVGSTPSDSDADQQMRDRIQELEAETERLREELRQAQQQSAGTTRLDDPAVVKQFLSPDPQPLDAVMQEIVESGSLDQFIRKRVENTVYYLAQHGNVEFARDPASGWRLTDTGNGGDG